MGTGNQSCGRTEDLWWRVGFAAVLTLSMGVGPLALYGLTALSPLIIDELGLSRTQFGSLATLCFVTAASFSMASSELMLRVSGRFVLLLLFAIAAAALIIVSMATGYILLLVAVCMSGVAQSISNPVTNQMLAGNLPMGRRGLTMGIKQSGVQMSQFVAGATLPVIAVVFGWRMAMLGSVLFPAVGMLAVALIVRSEPSDASSPPATGHGKSVPLPPGVWALGAYAFIMGFGLQATNVHLALFAFEEASFGAALSGVLIGAVGAVGLIARIGWGMVTERLRFPLQWLSFLAIGSAAGILAFALAGKVAPELIWVGVLLHGTTALASNVVVMMIVMRSVTHEEIGPTSGKVALGMYLGFATGPVAFGAITDATENYTVSWTCIGVLYLLAAMATRAWFIRRPSSIARG